MNNWAPCLACDITAGRVKAPGGAIFSDEYWICDHAAEPCLMAGWLILRPRRHVEHLAELSAEETAGLGGHIQTISQAMMHVWQLHKVYVCSFGEEVRHVHLSLLPIRYGLPLQGRLVLEGLHSGIWHVSPTEAAQAASQIRDELGVLATVSHLPPPPRIPHDQAPTGPSIPHPGQPSTNKIRFAPYDDDD